MKILIILFMLFFNLNLPVNADENICKKFDIKCKTKKYINETIEFQNKKWSETKKNTNEIKKKK